MAVTDQYYGARANGTGHTVQDFGLCDLSGNYQFTARLRAKGLLVVVFFAPNSAPSVRALETVQAWTQEVPTAKWTAVGVTDGDRTALTKFVQEHGLDAVSIVIDYELYQTRTWGVSHLPSIYVIDGKTGRVLQKVIGDNATGLTDAKSLLASAIGKIIAAEEAARKADEEKKAAEAAKAAKP